MTADNLSFNNHPTAAENRLQVMHTGQPYISMLACEARNPLTNISLAIELLQSDCTNDNRRESLEIIRKAALRINNLLNLILDYQVHSLGGVTHGSFRKILEGILVSNEQILRLRNITVTRNYEETNVEINMNIPLVKMALSSIVINAIESMPLSGGILKLTTLKEKQQYLLEISDNGCGIAANDMPNIFTPHYTEKPGGLGMGLALAYHILNAGNMQLRLHSKEKTGTMCSIVCNLS